ncbi:hypothetical protein G7074_02215 [Pedobacter sp. HDW13]|uniref:hypothetical protein n=1 Tax=unclassified Pedobacter TaxID=2628915 RepID=UPI000F5A4054|nr:MULTISPECIES: hypothetical protein [unclassified Pedobacter]QIL38192.1 hypothetical protein G7074_02215 [Pedobacter sp. HDW13]RQO64409.1 hypothetical protein DBR40_25640 [Pedobacter sp. KBW01]
MKFTTTLLCCFLTTLALVAQAQVPKKSEKNATDNTISLLMRLQIESMATTKGLSQEFINSQKKVDSAFNAVVKEYHNDSLFVSHLTESQRLWKLLRDSDIKAIYPNESPNYYGQINMDCIYKLLIKNNTERFAFINQWLKGTQEGDVCAGSIKFK